MLTKKKQKKAFVQCSCRLAYPAILKIPNDC